MKEEGDAHAYSIAFQLLGSVVIGLFALTQGFILPPLKEYGWGYVLISIFYGMGTLFLFNAYKYLEASEVTILTATRTIVTIVSAVVILGEVFSLQKGVGVVLILFSVVLVTWHTKKMKFNKGVFFALGMSICYGLGVTTDTFLLRSTNIFSYLTLGFFLPGVFLIILNPKKLLLVTTFLKPKPFFKLALMTSCYGVAALFFFQGIISGGGASGATPVLQTTVIMTVILGAVFLKERDHIIRKIVGALLVVCGVILIV